jgi:isopentenyl-diphosphate Delta-isomerase
VHIFLELSELKGYKNGIHSTGKSVMTATKYIKEDEVILVDENDQEIGKAEKILAHQNNLLHRAFSIFIFRKNSYSIEKIKDNDILLQQRAFHKYHSGGLWTNTCCSHPKSGESVISAGERRLAEEFGFRTKLKDIGWFHYIAHFANGLSENENDHVLVGTISHDIKIIPNQKEIHAYRWVGLDQLQNEITANPEQFTPWLHKALALVKAYIGETPLL